MASDVTSGCTFDTWTNGKVKVIWIETAATVDDTDYINVILKDYGCKTIEGITGYTHSTTDSIVISEAPTTLVTTGTLKITVGGSTDDKKRVFKVECDA